MTRVADPRHTFPLKVAHFTLRKLIDNIRVYAVQKEKRHELRQEGTSLTKAALKCQQNVKR